MNMTAEEIERRGNKRLNDLWSGLMQFEQEKLLERVKADPVRFKKIREFDDASYRYYQTKDGKGREVRFCYSVHRNIAGYFLAWREVINKDGSGKRDDWIANKVKRKLIERQRKLAQR